MNKNFSIFKAKEKKSEKAPDYNISLKVGEHYVYVGVCWLKSDKDGGKYFSCKLSDGYTSKDGKKTAGFVIEQEKAGSTLSPEEAQAIKTAREKAELDGFVDASSTPF